MWGFKLDALLRGCTQKAPAAGNADDGVAGTIGSSGGGAVDIFSALAGKAASDTGAASTPDTDQGYGELPPEVLSGRASHALSDYWGRLPTVWGRRRGESQSLEGDQPAT